MNSLAQTQSAIIGKQNASAKFAGQWIRDGLIDAHRAILRRLPGCHTTGKYRNSIDWLGPGLRLQIRLSG